MPFSALTVPADSKQYIIGNLHRNFSYYADAQIKQFTDSQTKTKPDLISALGSGPTGRLGGVMRTMAVIAKSCANEVIETLLQWRKETMAAADPADSLPHNDLSVRASYSFFSPDMTSPDYPRRLSTSSYTPGMNLTPEPTSARAFTAESREERRELAAVYILCQALITVFEEIGSEDISNELGNKMEEITFAQLKNADVESLNRCRNRQIISDMYARLIGSISGVRLATMSDRFIAELEKVPPGPIPNEPQVEIIIRGMRYLRLKIYPVDILEETAQFLLSCTKFFVQGAHGVRIRYAYSEVFTQLLLPIGAVADAEVNFPDWAKSMDLLLSRAIKMASKPRYLPVAYPFMTAVLCACRKEVFLAKMPWFLEQAFIKIKDRGLRAVTLGCLCRLVWAYLYRYRVPGKEAHKQLESLVKQMFGTRKRPTNLSDMPLEYYTYIVFCMLRYNLEWTVKNVISFLIHIDDTNPIPSATEYLQPERMIIGLRALLLYVQSDDLNEERPIFPDVRDLLASCQEAFTLPIYPRLKAELSVPALPWADFLFQLTDKVQIAQSQYFELLDATYGTDQVTKKRYVTFHPPNQGNPVADPDDSETAPSLNINSATSPTKAGGFGTGTHTVSGVPTSLLPTNNHSMASLATSFHPLATLAHNGMTSASLPTTAFAGMITSAKELTNEGQQYQQNFNTFSTVYPKDKQPFYDLLATLIDTTPDLTPSQILPQKLCEMLCNYLLHIDLKVARAAAGALVRLTDRTSSYSILAFMSQVLILVDDRVDEILTHHVYIQDPHQKEGRPPAAVPASPRREFTSTATIYNSDIYHQLVSNHAGSDIPGRTPTFHGPFHQASPGATSTAAGLNTLGTTAPTPTSAGLSTPTSSTIQGGSTSTTARVRTGGLLDLYLDIIQIFLNDIERLDRQGQLDSAADLWQTDHRAIISLIDDIEGFGLFYLCHRSSRVRTIAVAILRTIARIGEVLMPHLSDDHPIPMAPTDKVKAKQHNQMIYSRKFIYTELVTSTVPLGDLRDSVYQTFRHPTIDPTREPGNYSHHGPSSSISSVNSDGGPTWSTAGNPLSPSEGQPLVDPIVGTTSRDPSSSIASKPDPYFGAGPSTSTPSVNVRPMGVPTTGATLGTASAASNGNGQSIPVFDLACSPNPVYRVFWEEHFSTLVQKAYVVAPPTVILARDIVCRHFHQMFSLVVHYSEIPSKVPVIGFIPNRFMVKASGFDADLIEQWRFYLEFISATLMPNLEHDVVNRSHTFNRSLAKNMTQILTVGDLVKLTIPFFTCENPVVRYSVIRGLGSINEASYIKLVETLKPTINSLYEVTILKSFHKSYSGMKRDRKMDRSRASLVQLFRLTARYLKFNHFLANSEHLHAMVNFVKEIKNFLSDTGVQSTWEYQHLRIQCCGLVDVLFYYMSQLKDPTSIFSFKTRISLFRMFEQWCGFGQYSERTREREAAMIGHVLEKYHDVLERGTMASIMEEERTALEAAALQAMSTLCRGPVFRIPTPTKPAHSFNLIQLFQWIESIFASPDRRVHSVARNSLEWLLEFNQNHLIVLHEIIKLCYSGDPNHRCTHGYFFVLKKIIASDQEYPYQPHKLIPLALLKMGDPNPNIRHAAFRLIQAIERRFFKDRCYELFESAAFSPLATLYRHAQVGLSATLSERHARLTSDIITEVFTHLELVSEQCQREMLRFLRPWFCNIDLILDLDAGEIMEPGHCHLLHLFYLTLSLSKKHLGELEQLWSALVFKDNSSNCDLIVGFLVNLGLRKRNPTLLEYVKKVVMFLARTSINTHLVHTIVGYITPQHMIPNLQAEYSDTLINSVENIRPGPDRPQQCQAQRIFDDHFPTYEEGPMFSPSQIALILLVELPSEIGWLLKPYLPLLLHVLAVHVDYSYPRVSPLISMMLANFIRYMVLDKHEPLETVDDLLAQLSAAERVKRDHGLPFADLSRFVKQLVEVFGSEELEPKRLQQLWGSVALHWGTQCPVRNVACASFRIFSVIMPRVTLGMCIEMINRLSNTIADDKENIQEFSVSILTIFAKVLRSIRPEGGNDWSKGGRDSPDSHTSTSSLFGSQHDSDLDADEIFRSLQSPATQVAGIRNQNEQSLVKTRLTLAPVLFWTAAVCLFSHLESEYEQGLVMLEIILQYPSWRFPSIHKTDHLLRDRPLHIQAQMGFPIATLAAQASAVAMDASTQEGEEEGGTGTGSATSPGYAGHHPLAAGEPHPAVPLRTLISKQYPKKWGGHFPGLFWLLIRGFRFPSQRPRCQKLINQLISLASEPLVGIVEAAVGLLLLVDFPLLCQHIQNPDPGGEADLLMDMLAVIIPDVVQARPEAQRALLQLCASYKAQSFYSVEHFIKEVVKLFGEHFMSYIPDAMFLLLLQLPTALVGNQDILLQTMEIFVTQCRTSVVGLFDREDTLPTVNILLGLMTSPFEARVSNILDCLVLRSPHPAPNAFLHEDPSSSGLSAGSGRSPQSPPFPPHSLNRGLALGIKTFTWYGFNSAVSRPKTRHQLSILVKTVAAQELINEKERATALTMASQLAHRASRRVSDRRGYASVNVHTMGLGGGGGGGGSGRHLRSSGGPNTQSPSSPASGDESTTDGPPDPLTTRRSPLNLRSHPPLNTSCPDLHHGHRHSGGGGGGPGWQRPSELAYPNRSNSPPLELYHIINPHIDSPATPSISSVLSGDSRSVSPRVLPVTASSSSTPSPSASSPESPPPKRLPTEETLNVDDLTELMPFIDDLDQFFTDGLDV
ncbi:cell morphogenesis N-terminal-domain-containing protein [Dimargaris cristalligena]|uniref:Cell morphogenesis N-terminal-domain-containing protein n=1 Tax=Dimargaris cristalligena TaxID=215637 RepID=A0A4P9ZYJ3_9FUNG|nr:cell morphogenesis N-terminal-domain-containing protein [Dimargaris cristalligena]|eukprot:RKP38757.1 cell morphogenesis N-terminal-domain-containing protein [Dimargaris cristalligena]